MFRFKMAVKQRIFVSQKQSHNKIWKKNLFLKGIFK